MSELIKELREWAKNREGYGGIFNSVEERREARKYDEGICAAKDEVLEILSRHSKDTDPLACLA